MIDIYAVQISNFPTERIESLLMCVTEEKRQKLNRFHFEKDRVRGLVGDLLVKMVLSQTLSIPYTSIQIDTNDYQKPYLAQPKEQLEFNLSHSGEWVVCATDSHSVGVDVERIATFDMNVAQRYFSKEEYEYITSADNDEERNQRWCKVWTAKESYIKAVGKGLSIPLESFSTVDQTRMASSRIIDERNWHFREYWLESQYCLSVCATRDDFSASVEIVDIQSLVSYFN